MEVGLISIIVGLAENGLLTAMSVQVISLFVLVFSIHFYLKPMKNKLAKMPSGEDMHDAVEKKRLHDDLNFQEISKTLDKLSTFIDAIDESEKNHTRDLTNIKGDIEHVKSILNQLHGHMMYNSQPSFGNRELR